MLRRQDKGTFRQVFETGDLYLRTDELLVQPYACSGPEFRDEPGAEARRQKIVGCPEDHLHDQVRVEGDVEDERTEDEHVTAPGIGDRRVGYTMCRKKEASRTGLYGVANALPPPTR